MGKPFQKELEKINETLSWAYDQLVDDFRKILLFESKVPLYIVGSGGSLSACHFAAQLYQEHGMMAKAVTPLELVYALPSAKHCNILFISASGKNTDIIFAYDKAVQAEPNHIIVFTMKSGSPIALKAKTNSITSVFEFKNPAGKDGFLATNSLAAFFAILAKTMSIDQLKVNDLTQDEHFGDEISTFIDRVSSDFTFNVIGIGWGQPVAVDIESKLAEAALADVLITDWRNFGHGRHHWFAKRLDNSAIIALISPRERQLAMKTLKLLPKDIPVLRLETEQEGPLASIDLLVKSFDFVAKLGALQGIDPGRPGVPDFGSKLYNLKYQSLFSKLNGVQRQKELAIARKAGIADFQKLSVEDKLYWTSAYEKFTSELARSTFGSIVFDYDGTLCSSANRLNGLDSETIAILHEILAQGIIIGIATGRGKSVREDLTRVIDKKYWDQILVGYYNCSDIGVLSDNTQPDKSAQQNMILKKIYDQLVNENFIAPIKPELKPHQIVIEIEDVSKWAKVRVSVLQFIINLNLENIQILESSHSMDIIDQTKTNKLNILPHCIMLAQSRGLSDKCLSIGDKGKWPGNDYQLLSHKTSLSVDEVSQLPESGWNLSEAGIKNLESTKKYLSWMSFKPQGFNLNFT